MTTQPEALRLADALEHDPLKWCDEAAAELRRQHEENGRLRIVAEMSTLLLDQRSALLEALKGITPPMPPADAPCHVGLVPQEKCAHCGRIARARAAIKQAQGENT